METPSDSSPSDCPDLPDRIEIPHRSLKNLHPYSNQDCDQPHLDSRTRCGPYHQSRRSHSVKIEVLLESLSTIIGVGATTFHSLKLVYFRLT